MIEKKEIEKPKEEGGKPIDKPNSLFALEHEDTAKLAVFGKKRAIRMEGAIGNVRGDIAAYPTEEGTAKIRCRVWVDGSESCRAIAIDCLGPDDFGRAMGEARKETIAEMERTKLGCEIFEKQ